MRHYFALILVVVGCGGHNNDVTPDACTDADGDGVTDCAGDCDDSDANTYPGAPEVCGDAKDNNCDGVVDEGCMGLGTFVSAMTGSDTNPGTQAMPVATIGQGMANAAAIGGGQDVYVAQGHYTEKITMVEARDLLGGYDCAALPCTWARDPATYDSALFDTDFEGVLVGDTITRATKIDGFRIMGFGGSAPSAPGGAALTVNGAITISNNKIVGGDLLASASGTASIGVAVYSPSGNPLIATNDITLGTSPGFAAGVDFLRGIGAVAGSANGEVRKNVIHGGAARTTAGVYGGFSGAGTIIAGNTITSGTSNVGGGGAWGIQGFGTMLIDSNKINAPPATPGTCVGADVCGGIESQSSTMTITNNIIYGAATPRAAAVRLREVEVAAGVVVVNSNFLDGGGTQSPGGNSTQSAAVMVEYTGCGNCGINAVMGRIRNNILLGGQAAQRFDIFEAPSQAKTNRPEALENNVFWFAASIGVSVDVMWRRWNGATNTDLTTIVQVNAQMMPTAVANQNADPTVDATWHLVTGSPCIDMGTATESPTTDMDGAARPNNGTPDIGPDEM